MDYEDSGMLDEEIKTRFDKLKNYEPGSAEYSEAVEGLTKLYKLKIDETQNEINHEKDVLQIESENKHRKIGYVLSALGLGLPLIFNSVWMFKGFKFEEKGTICSQTFKWLTNGFRSRTN